MKALRIEAAGKTAYGTAAEPTAGAGDVLLRVKRVGYCGSDLSTFRGLNPLVSYPRIPGHEIAAEIVSVGKDVPATLKTGAQVTVMPYTACGQCPSCRAGRVNACQFNQTLGVQRDGALTELLVAPWQKIITAPLGLAELALIEPLSVGFHAVNRGRVTKADTVLIFGCGMIGLGAIAAAGLHRGATVIAADIDDAKLALARRAGATHTINSRTANLHAELEKLTSGGPTVVIEAVGSPETFVAAVSEVAFAGRVVYIGYAKAPVTYETKYFVMKELDILGSRNATPEDFAAVIDLLRSGRYPSQETITRTVPWSEAGAALAAWSADPSKVTKIQVDLTA
jgi:2-desacetyl-2-hydroxyethyl bacteriochlorophyllide A dehydrogenase